MSIPTYVELRRQVQALASEVGHPVKAGRYGRVVYVEGGAVAGLFDGCYLVAQGGDHEDSILALARHLGLTGLDNGVTVEEVSGGHFWLLACGDHRP